MAPKLLEYAEARITVGDCDVSIRRKSGGTTVASILGRTAGVDGSTSIWLDRLVHKEEESRIGGLDCPVYGVFGAYVSVLVAPAGGTANADVAKSVADNSPGALNV